MKLNPFREIQNKYPFFKNNDLKIRSCIDMFPDVMQLNANFGNRDNLPDYIRVEINKIISSLSYSECESFLNDLLLDEPQS
jgi:hypothetical protein